MNKAIILEPDERETLATLLRLVLHDRRFAAILEEFNPTEERHLKFILKDAETP